MSRKRKSPPPETFSIWTSFTDLMSNAFMVLTLLLLLTITKNPSLNPQKQLKQPDDNKQQIIVLPAEEYQFPSGRAEIPNNLKNNISQNGQDGPILKAIKQEIEKAERQIDIIEVIGHTDGEEVGSLACHGQLSGQRSNLDQELEAVATQTRDIAVLCPGSNADLGLMRALAVVKELQKVQQQEKEGRFKQLQFRAYSAGQLLLPKNRGFAQPETQRKADEQRRRIEIRFTQLAQETTPK